MQIVDVTELNIADAGYIHSESWKESHKSFCSAEFVAKHTPEAQTEYLRREMADGKKIPITHWENIIGRHKRSDVVIDFPTVSRHHGVLTRYDDGSWTIADTGSKAGVYVNGKRVRIAALDLDDVISLCGIEMKLLPAFGREFFYLPPLPKGRGTVAVWHGGGILMFTKNS